MSTSNPLTDGYEYDNEGYDTISTVTSNNLDESDNDRGIRILRHCSQSDEQPAQPNLTRSSSTVNATTHLENDGGIRILRHYSSPHELPFSPNLTLSSSLSISSSNTEHNDDGGIRILRHYSSPHELPFSPNLTLSSSLSISSSNTGHDDDGGIRILRHYPQIREQPLPVSTISSETVFCSPPPYAPCDTPSVIAEPSPSFPGLVQQQQQQQQQPQYPLPPTVDLSETDIESPPPYSPFDTSPVSIEPPPSYEGEVRHQQQPEQQQQQQATVAYDVPTSQRVNTASRPCSSSKSYVNLIALSCFVFWCFNPVFGFVAFILAVYAETSRFDHDKRAILLSKSSMWLSISGVIVGLITVIILVGTIVGRPSPSSNNSTTSYPWSQQF